MSRERIKELLLLLTIFAVVSIPVMANTGNTAVGHVYTISNDLTNNKVIVYDRASNGELTISGNFPTGGTGSGMGLGSQGGVVLSGDMLLVVNAGSNEISAFHVESTGLTLTDKINSGGNTPISITIYKNLVYVLNAGGNGDIAGFHLSNKGKLSQIPGSIQNLSGVGVAPAEVAFNPDGKVLVVTEKSTNIIDTYTVDDNGIAHGPITHTSNGQTPFGFAFDTKGHLIVSEATNNSLSSYAVDNSGNLSTLSDAIPDFHKAPCWVVVTNNGNFVYTNNAHDGTTSSYADDKGLLTLANPVAGSPGAGNIDLALSNNGEFLYSLNPNTIIGFRVNPDGNLTTITTVGSPIGANGLAAH